MKNELISMVAYVLGNLTSDAHHSCHLMQKYANFLNTPLNISMFVPAIEVDGKWEVLEEPIENDFELPWKYESKWHEWRQAKDKVIFEGFDLIKTVRDLEILIINYDNETIQDLIKYAPTLTEYGKQISGYYGSNR